MKRINLRFILWSCLFLVISCEEPETVVTNYIHRDGSVTRLIEMRSLENDFSIPNVQLPYDSTWSVRDSAELLDDKGDSMWVRRVKKTFNNIEEINVAYASDSSYNHSISRSVSLEKQFRWFNTEYRFSENVGKLLEFGLPMKDFLSEEEITFYFSPEYSIEELKDGPDSTRIRKMRRTIDEKAEVWIEKSLISEWIGQFGKLTKGNAEQLVGELRNKESVIYHQLKEEYSEKFDSLWEAGIIQRDIMGEENAGKFRAEADSAFSIALENVMPSFKNYSVRMVLPGNLTGTNGYLDSTKVLSWPVSSDYFLTEPYEMWAESKVTNIWAWIVSGLFLLFVLTGIIIRTIKKAE